MGVEKRKLISGITVKFNVDGPDIQTVQTMSEQDIALTEQIKYCGTNKTPYKIEIINLFKRYVDPSQTACPTCGVQIMMMLTNYLEHYEKYIQQQNG